MPLPLQSLGPVQCVRLDGGKTRYLNILAQDHNFFWCKDLHCYRVFKKWFWERPVLKQPNKPAPALMHTEASLAQQYHGMGMKNSPATRLDCVFGTE